MAQQRSKTPGVRAQRHARKKARILAAARALLRLRGHENLSLRHVARRARMSPAGMYEFFDNREHLVDVLAGEASEALASALRAATDGTQEPVERLVKLGLAYLRFAQERPMDFTLLFARRSTRRSLAGDVPENSEYSIIRTAIEDLLGSGERHGEGLRLLEVLAYGYWSSVHGMAVLQLTHLADFEADFATAHRFLLEDMARSWQQSDWKKALGRRFVKGSHALEWPST